MSNASISYSDILSRFDGPADFSRLIGVESEAAKQIFKRKSIPAHYGLAIVAAKKATPAELLTAAAQKRQPAEPL